MFCVFGEWIRTLASPKKIGSKPERCEGAGEQQRRSVTFVKKIAASDM